MLVRRGDRRWSRTSLPPGLQPGAHPPELGGHRRGGEDRTPVTPAPKAGGLPLAHTPLFVRSWSGCPLTQEDAGRFRAAAGATRELRPPCVLLRCLISPGREPRCRPGYLLLPKQAGQLSPSLPFVTMRGVHRESRARSGAHSPIFQPRPGHQHGSEPPATWPTCVEKPRVELGSSGCEPGALPTELHPQRSPHRFRFRSQPSRGDMGCPAASRRHLVCPE